MNARVTPVLGVAEDGPVKSYVNGETLQWQCVDILNLLQLRALAMLTSSCHHYDRPLSKRRMEFLPRYGSHHLNKPDRAPLRF